MFLSLVMPFYRNSRMLCRHLMVWRDEWSAELKRDIEIVLVDDGSPEPAADVIAEMWNGDRTGLPALSLYRVLEDRPWHQHGARNLGAHVAEGRWLLMTDMDHVVPASTLNEILGVLQTTPKNDVLTFGRVDAPATLTWRADHWTEFARTRREDGTLKPHVNSFCVSRKRYWALGGYDEDFVGYGTDAQFRRHLFGHGSTVQHLDHAPIIRVDRNVIADASTTTYSRDARCKIKTVLARKLLAGRAGKNTVLNFPWTKVAL